MRSLADRIEQYLRVLLDRSSDDSLEVQRIELAETFGCVPSQISYVLATRFTPDRGFIIQSRRGGKGYLRITRVRALPPTSGGEGVGETEALALVEALERRGSVTEREARLLRTLLGESVLGLGGSEGAALRGRLLAAALRALEIAPRQGENHVL
ncbi:MAG: CtsR family transcriptional regulator [Syntrophomonadaceae bacterium]|jgi:transcriptional regulator CtsR|nr:CtsR family transcriptional regulator [Syntrophomonadaceae bacterium]MDH7497619.1 CtsR family transcriptional regulator [Syntrophomonadaceae bacterium]